ncbi:thymidylate synthase [Chitinophaga sp. S165]|uniref:thymidylate synthase n=1 Tax=Chitinophaga sp. S165 TaxID=2135462 RepID=UPI000D70E5BD|nr:thymidylate synthase [Chitinophaga sp. S165]PWV46443.1 thymidylate synthase [Chitinophaga sp. S165]
MYFEGPTLDDILNDVFKSLINLPFDNQSTRSNENGNSSEIIGPTLKLLNPRSRLSRTETKGTVFSAIGELLWYLSGDNSLDFIKYYIQAYENETDDGITIHGGYGPRLFKAQDEIDQIANVIELLRKKPSSRRAAIQIFEARDLKDFNYKDIPCTCTLQFLIRQNKLSMVVYMRSNDAYKGLPHDVFAFTMLQEIIAKTLGVELGDYIHSIGSLHLYESSKSMVNNYLDEGAQSTKIYMASMPDGDPWNSINKLLEIEEKIRKNEEIDISNYDLPNYWQDIAYLLVIFSLAKNDKTNEVKEFRRKVSDSVYHTYIDKKINNKKGTL